LKAFKLTNRVFRAINESKGHVVACKVVNIHAAPGVGVPSLKDLQKEVQVHRSLRNNSHILEFVHSTIIDKEREQDGIVPGLYMLLELAVGGDLFDKIGAFAFTLSAVFELLLADSTAPDVGVPEDLAKFYFAQLVAGVVSSGTTRES
jgi:serine/threonine-protein kinase Chk1